MHSSRMRTVDCSAHWRGVSVCPGGVCLGECLPKMVSAQGGVCPGGLCPSACWITPPTVNIITDVCENITLPQLRYVR